jgi:hypothetical protein
MRTRKSNPSKLGVQEACTVLLVMMAASCASVSPTREPIGSATIAAIETSSLAPLTAIEQGQCADVATQVFREMLAGDRFAILLQVPVYRRSDNRFPRTCKVEIFDYTKNIDLQATIELATATVINSRQLKDVQPAVGPSEIALARSIAETSAESRGRLSKFVVRPLEHLEITTMIRTDGEKCRIHRCVEIDYYETGPTAGTTAAAEPTSAQVPWQPINPLAQVIVDLTNIAVLSLVTF